MASAQQIEELQSQIDSGQIDPRQLDQEQQDSLKELINRGVLKAPAGGLSRMSADREQGESGIIQQAKDANQFGGLSTPFGKVMTERSSYEMVGDVIGSFIPYLNNRRAIVKDVIKGVETTDSKGNVIKQPYSKPTGKDALRLEKFDKVNTRFANALSAVVGKRAGLVGKAFVRTASFLERTALRGGQLLRAERDVFKTGDVGRSMLRAGARTEAQSLIGGAGGAATGSALYDMSNYIEDLSANLTMDVGDLTEEGINSNPFPMRLLQHSAIAASASLKYGVLGSGIGYYAGRYFGKGKNVLLGLNSKDSVAIAKMSAEQGVPLSPTALASEGFGGFLSRNFFRIFGVTPYVGGAGTKKVRKTVSEVVFPKYLNVAGSLSPNTTVASIVSESGLGAEGISLMTKNYHMNSNIINVTYDTLLKSSKGMDHPPIVGTSNLKKAINTMTEEVKGLTGSQFRAFAEQTLETKPPKLIKERLEKLKMVNSLEELTQQGNMSVYDAALYRRFIYDTLGDPKNIKNKEIQEEGRKLLSAFDADLGAAESIEKLDLTDSSVARFVESMKKGSPEENLKAATEASIKMARELRKTNQTYLQLVNSGMYGMGKNQKEALLANALNNPELVNSQEIFNSIFKSAITEQNPQALKEMKTLLGVGSGEYNEYATAFMGKLGTRFVFDAFTSSFNQAAKKGSEAFDPAVVFREDLTKADEIIPDIINSKPEYKALFPNKKFDSTTNYVDADLFNKLDKFAPEDAKRIEEALASSVSDIKIDPKNVDSFDISRFRKNLGIDTANGRQTLVELFGAEHTKNIVDLTEVLTRSVDIGITDPSTFLLRRLTLSGSAVGASVLAGVGMFGLGGGIIGSILPAVAARYYGKWIANPATTKKALDLYTKEERRALLQSDMVGPIKNFPFTGGKEAGDLGGFFDPTQPLGKFLGPSRTRNIAIFLNAVAGTPNSDPIFNAENITYQDIQNFIESETEGVPIPNPSASPFQLPPSVMQQMFPEAYAFKQLSVEDKQTYLETLKAATQGEAQDEEFNRQVSQMPDEQPQQQAPQQNQQQAEAPVQPTDVAQTPNQKINLSSKYSFLFPQDAAGQAIAQQQETKSG